MSSRLARLDVAIAESRTLSADFNFCIVDDPDAPIQDITKFISVELSPAVAETRTCAVVLDVHIDRAVQADLDVLIQGTTEKVSGLQVNIQSPDLQVGASAVYNEEGDEVESILYVEDNETLHPEYVQQMTATLLYKGEHVLGMTSFTAENGNEDGTIVNAWIHPAHISNLSVRYQGTLLNIGEVDFTVSAEEDNIPDIPLGENVLEGVDNEEPRTEQSSFASAVHELEPAPGEVTVLDSEVVLTLLQLNMLSQFEFFAEGNGTIDYRGGGNRLLSSLDNDGSFVFQNKGEFPPKLNAHTRIEEPRTNLLTNANFLSGSPSDPTVPLGWTLTAASSITLLPALLSDSSGVGIAKIRAFGSGSYVGPKSIIFTHDAAVAATPANPVTFSVLARTELANSEVIVKDLSLIISFRDSGDAELSQEVIDFEPATIAGTTFALLQHTVAIPPVGTTAARVSIEMESIETSDDISLFLLGPQFETGESATSSIVGATPPTNRAADILRVSQASNIEFARGSAITIYAPDYDGLPPSTACLFDTRDDAGLNGLAAFHLADGRLQFAVAGPISQKTIETAQVFSFQAGIFQEIGVSWANNFMQIQVNSEEEAVDTGSLVLPQAFNEWIYLFQTTAGSDRLNGELASFEIRRDVQQ